jgi:hypothetical protein
MNEKQSLAIKLWSEPDCLKFNGAFSFEIGDGNRNEENRILQNCKFGPITITGIYIIRLLKSTYPIKLLDRSN